RVKTFNAQRIEGGETPFLIRAGVHSGPAVGGIVGTSKYIYDVFGDTINTGSRIEQWSEPMRVNVSEATYELTRDVFGFEDRGNREVKGKGALRMFFAAQGNGLPLARVATATAGLKSE